MNKKITFIFLTVIMLLVIATSVVNATGSLGVVNIETENKTTNTTTNVVSNNTTQNKTNVINTNKTNTVSNNATKLPETGIEENTMLIVSFIGISIVSAVYAYTKIKKYNNI